MSLAPPPIPPGFIARWCATLSENSESPPGSFLPTGLAVLSATVGPRLVMQWTPTHGERMNLWTLNVGMSAAARKTSGISALEKAVRWAQAQNDDLVRLAPMARVSDAGIVAAFDVLGQDAQKAAAEGREPVERTVPVSWVALFNEVSPVWTGRDTGYVQDAQRTLLQIYDGKLSSNTKATNVPYQETFVTAIGNIPPNTLRDNTTLAMLSSGFVGRWLAIPTPAPETLISFPEMNGNDPTWHLREDVDSLMRLARSGERFVVNQHGKGLWSEKARAFRQAWYEHRFREIPPDTSDPLMTARVELFGRLQATALKVATLLAVSRQLGQIDSLAELVVDEQDVEWAAEVIDGSIDYIIGALEDSGAEATTTLGKTEGRIVRFLNRNGPQTVSAVAGAVKGGNVSYEDVKRAIEALKDVGQVDEMRDGRTKVIALVG